MDFSSLPSYPAPLLSRSAGIRSERERWLTPRHVQVLVDLAWLTLIVVLLFWLRQTVEAIRRPPPPPPEPLPFELVAERFSRISYGMPVDQVFALLGPQQYTKFREPEMEDIERMAERRSYLYPGEWYWAKWGDPANPSRWVAVFISDDRVRYILKQGV